MRSRSVLAAALAGGLALVAGVGVAQTTFLHHPPPPGAVTTAPQFLTAPLPPGSSPEVQRGRYLAIAGDCAACHTPEGKPPFSGGLGLHTPFGVIYSSNLTSDRDAGIGAWTPDQFWRAMHEGRRADGAHLYPAFPYPNFTRASRADSDALLAYLKTVPAVHAVAPSNALPFPFNIRAMMMGWNLLFFRPAAFQPAADRSAEWNRGAYLVQTFGHCGACHTPKNVLGADSRGHDFQGGKLESWYAPNLTEDPHVGLGRWSQADVVEFLKTGRNQYAQAAGTMAEVITDSTSLMTDADLAAMATYLKSLPAAGGPTQVRTADAGSMRAGKAVYEDVCAGCHREGGQGVARFFPNLAGHPDVESRDPNNVVRVVLEGARTAPTPTRPTPLSMPSYAWQLNDRQIADVLTYVRQSWGNQAEPVSPGEVAGLRRSLKLQTSHGSTWARQ